MICSGGEAISDKDLHLWHSILIAIHLLSIYSILDCWFFLKKIAHIFIGKKKTDFFLPMILSDFVVYNSLDFILYLKK